jgi:hypothetical protein
MLHQANGDDPEFGWASFDPLAPSSARLRSCWSCAAAASCTRRRSSATRHPGDARPRRTSCRCRSIAPDDPPTATPPHHRPHRPQAARTAPRARHSRPAPHLAGGPSPVCCTEDAGVGVGEAVSNVCTGTSTGTDAQADAQNTTSTPHRTRRQRTRAATSAHIPLGGLLRPPAPRPRPTPTPCRCHRYGRRQPSAPRRGPVDVASRRQPGAAIDAPADGSSAADARLPHPPTCQPHRWGGDQKGLRSPDTKPLVSRPGADTALDLRSCSTGGSDSCRARGHGTRCGSVEPHAATRYSMCRTR